MLSENTEDSKDTVSVIKKTLDGICILTETLMNQSNANSDQELTINDATTTASEYKENLSLFNSASIVEFETTDNKTITWLVKTVSDFDIKIAQIKNQIDVSNQTRDIIHGTKDDLIAIAENSLYLVDWLIGLPRRPTTKTYTKIQTDICNKVRAVLITERRTKGINEPTIEAEFKIFIDNPDNYQINDINAFINCIDQSVNYANYKLVEEYNTDYQRFIDYYYNKESDREFDNIKKYDNLYCAKRTDELFNECLKKIQTKLIKDFPSKQNDIEQAFKYDKVSPNITTQTMSYKQFDLSNPTYLVSTDSSLEETNKVSFTYDNQYFGNRILRSFRNLQLSLFELKQDYKEVLFFSSSLYRNVYYTEETIANHIKKTKTIPVKQTHKEWFDEVGKIWSQGNGVDGKQGDSQLQFLIDSLYTIYKTIEVAGCSLAYLIKMIAQLIAPVVSLPLLIVYKLLKFVWKELIYKLVSDDLRPFSFEINTALPLPFELLLSLTKIGYHLLKLLFRPIKMATSEIIYGLRRILQTMSLIIKPLTLYIVKNSTFRAYNFLMKIVAFDQGVNQPRIKNALNNARIRRLCDKFDGEITKYRNAVMDKIKPVLDDNGKWKPKLDNDANVLIDEYLQLYSSSLKYEPFAGAKSIPVKSFVTSSDYVKMDNQIESDVQATEELLEQDLTNVKEDLKKYIGIQTVVSSTYNSFAEFVNSTVQSDNDIQLPKIQ